MPRKPSKTAELSEQAAPAPAKKTRSTRSSKIKVGDNVMWTDENRADEGPGLVKLVWTDPRGVPRAEVEWGPKTYHTGAKISDLKLA